MQCNNYQSNGALFELEGHEALDSSQTVCECHSQPFPYVEQGEIAPPIATRMIIEAHLQIWDTNFVDISISLVLGRYTWIRFTPRTTQPVSNGLRCQKAHTLPIPTTWCFGDFVWQAGCIVEGEAQKSPSSLTIFGVGIF